MRIAAILAGLYLVSSILFLNNKPANAISFEETNKSQPVISKLIASSSNENPEASIFKSKTEPAKKVASKSPVKKVKKAPKVVKHTVLAGETLSKIADSYKVEWQRIYDKNKSVTDPNLINVGDVLVIPGAKEKLKKRTIAAPVQPMATQIAPQQPAVAPAAPVAQAVPAPMGSSAGNTYTYGYCTFYAKSRRPDLPNNLGNADTWVAMAAAQGIPTGSTPRVGAVGQQGMHVVYVESVNANGTVTISEMNFEGWGVVSSRTVPASSFQYIY